MADRNAIINILDHIFGTCGRIFKRFTQTQAYNFCTIVKSFFHRTLDELESEYLLFGAILIRRGHERANEIVIQHYYYSTAI